MGKGMEMDLYACDILLVDDNRELQEMLRELLEREGYLKLRQAYSCEGARLLFGQREPDLVLLDVMLPDGDGFSLFQEFRADTGVPILFLSAKDEDNDRLRGLGLGADDYITKPFLPQELLLRIQAVLKRVYLAPILQAQKEQTARIGQYRVDLRNAVVDRNGQQVRLTAKELLLFRKLWENRGNIVTFDALCRAVWDDDYYGYENTLMVHIRRLREKIEEDPSHPRWIRTARGLGYRLEAGGREGR